MHIFNIQHKEHVQISHDSYIRKPRLSGNFLGNEGVRINEVSLYTDLNPPVYTDLNVVKVNYCRKYKCLYEFDHHIKLCF